MPDPGQIVYDVPAYRIGTISIPVIFHVIYASDGTGNVAYSQLQDQISKLNSGFSGSAFSFYLAGVSRTQNDDWRYFSRGSQTEQEMAQALSVDPQHALNFYTTDLGVYTLGWVINWPWEISETSYLNGVVIHFGSLPEGDINDFNEGDTGVHEVGHFLGLYHTFQGGCTSPGDEVDDTPPHQMNTGCPDPNPDTCPGLPGLDPIHNYMNYTNDPCMDELSAGQFARAEAIVGQHKPNLGGTNLFFTSDFSVPSGRNWDFYDSTLKFASGKRIYVYGTLNTSSVTLTASGSSWNGIYFGTLGEGVIEYSVINKLTGGAGSGGITISSASNTPSLEYSTVDVLSGSYVFGIYSTGNARVYRSTIRSASGPALYASGSDGYLSVHDSDIIQTSGNPTIRAEGSGIVACWIAAMIYDGKNKLKGGKLYASGNAIINAGEASGSKDKNHFCDAASATLEVASGGTIYARYDYWPDGNPPTQINNGGSIYYSPNLGSSDCSDVSMMLASTGDSEADAQLSVNSNLEKMGLSGQNYSTDPRALLFEAKDKARAGLYAEAAALFERIIQSKQMPEAHTALLELGLLFKETRNSGMQNLVRAIANQEGTLQASAKKILADSYAFEGKQTEAFQVLDEIIRLYPGTPDAFFALLSRFYLHFQSGSYHEAAKELDAIQPKSEDEAIAIAAAWQLLSLATGNPLSFQQANGPKEGDSSTAKTVSELAGLEVSAFPNPFNPMAIIRYQLPREAHVTLKVFDMLGREVVTLVNERRNAGIHEAHFEASSLPSGVYVYRIEAGGILKLGKLVLQK